MALNDPQWGNRNKGGPPDLEEMLRNFNQKLSAWFGGGNRNGGSQPGGASPGFGLGLIVVIVLLVWIASGFYTVDSSERGIVLRFGKYTETTQPGAHWHLPYPIESAEIVNFSQVRTLEVGYRNDNPSSKNLSESLMLTDDLNIIDIQFSVQYLIKNPTDYLFNNRMSNDKEIVRQAAEAAIREVVGKSKLDYALYEGRAQVTSETSKLLQSILDRYKTGIMVSQVNLQQAQPPEQVQAAFDDAVKAQQDRDRQINLGKAYAADVVPRAQGQAARLLQEADGYKQAVIANAEGDASRFKQILAAYNKAPRVTRERMYIDMMQQILSSTSKVMIDQHKGNSLLYLPLDQLIKSATPVTLPAMEPQAAPKPDVRNQGARDDSPQGLERRANP